MKSASIPELSAKLRLSLILMVQGGITESFYEKKRDEYRAKQNEIDKKVNKLQFADEEYYFTSEYILKLASRASELFKSSEMQEERLLLKMTLQNMELKGKKTVLELGFKNGSFEVIHWLF